MDAVLNRTAKETSLLDKDLGMQGAATNTVFHGPGITWGEHHQDRQFADAIGNQIVLAEDGARWMIAKKTGNNRKSPLDPGKLGRHNSPQNYGGRGRGHGCGRGSGPHTQSTPGSKASDGAPVKVTRATPRQGRGPVTATKRRRKHPMKPSRGKSSLLRILQKPGIWHAPLGHANISGVKNPE